MIKRLVLAAVSVATLSLGVQSGADAALPAQAAPRLIIPETGTNAVIRKKPVINGVLQIGNELQGVVWTAEGGDPPCDATGRTMYVGHTWRAGNGTADRWVTLKKGDIVKIAGCKFKVYKKARWSDDRSLAPLSKRTGRAEAALVACWPSDYRFNQIIYLVKV
jgi:hypothetical protein